MPPALDNEVDVVSDSVRQEFVGDAEKTVTTHTTHSDDVAPETIYKKPDNSLKNKLKAIFKYVAGSIRLEIHSDPVYLGTFTPAADGTVEGEYSLPPDLPIGYHELHFIYTDTSGQEQDVYQTVLVLDSPDDWDGDGILNTQEVSCAIGDNNDTTDINGDGYGDSCISYKEGSRQNDDTSNTEYLIQQAAANGIITPQEVALVYRALGKQPVTKVVSEQSRLTTSQTQTSTRSERSITHRKTSSNNLSTSQKAQNSAKRTLTLAVLAILICIGVVIAFVIRMCARRKPQ